MPEITLQLPSLKPSDKLGIFITNDFRIRKTNPGSIGEQAGFLAGDLLVSIDELRITKGMDKLTIASTMRGDPSKVQAPKSIVVTRETPEDEDEDEDEQGWHTDPEDSHENAKKDEEGEDKDEGLVTLSVPSMPVGVRMGLSVAAGNVVRSVDPGSYAELAGFRTSDVVVSVGGVPMAGVEKLEVATRIRGDRTAITRPCKVLVRRSAANSVAVAEAAQLKLPAEESADVAAEAARAAKAPIGLIGSALEKAPVVQSQGIVDVSSADLISLQQAFEQASLKGLHSGLKVVHFPEHVNINVNKQPLASVLASVHTTLPPPPGRRTSGTAPCATDDLD
eukprot:jgi/Chrpa1/2472/Chrysochromulina_OHIO_Genome00008382-RA